MPLTSAVRLTATAFFLSIVATASAYADALTDIRARGEIIIGVRDDDPPYGFRNENGELQGLEIDLARDIAERVGVPLKTFVINPTSRLQFIELALNDALIGMLTVTDRRKQQVRLIEPYYYATSIALLERPRGSAATAAGLGPGGMTICGLKGSYYMDAFAHPPAGLPTVPVRTLQEARTALSKGRCDAIAAETATLVTQQKLHRNLAGHKLVAADVEPLPWAIAINSKMAGSDFERLLSEAVTDWHRSGKLKELEQKWLGRNTEWILRQHEAHQ